VGSRLTSKIRSILKDHFPGIVIDDLRRPRPGGGIGGVLVWDGFSSMEQVERQRRIWEVLRARLTVEEQQSLSLMITLTPDELRSIRAA